VKRERKRISKKVISDLGRSISALVRGVDSAAAVAVSAINIAAVERDSEIMACLPRLVTSAEGQWVSMSLLATVCNRKRLAGEALAISIPRTEAAVIRHF
jgi:hypothetical protein